MPWKLPTIQSVYVCAARQDIGPARSTHIYPDLFLYNQIYDVCLNISKTQASIPAPATVMGPYPARPVGTRTSGPPETFPLSVLYRSPLSADLVAPINVCASVSSLSTAELCSPSPPQLGRDTRSCYIWVARGFNSDPNPLLRITVDGTTLYSFQPASASGVYSQLREVAAFTAIGTSAAILILGNDGLDYMHVDDVSLSACL